MAPQFLSLVPHVMLNLMPSLEEHRLDLYLESVVDAHLPGLRGDLGLQVARKPEYPVELCGLEFILAAFRGGPLYYVKCPGHYILADVHIIVEIQIDAHSDKVLQLVLFIEILALKLARHGLGCLCSGKAAVIESALLQPVAYNTAKILFHQRRDLHAGRELLFCK